MPNKKVPHPKVWYDLMTKSYYLKYKKKYEKLPPPPPKQKKPTKEKKVPPPPKPVKIEVVKASKVLMDEYKKFEAQFASKKKNREIKNGILQESVGI